MHLKRVALLALLALLLAGFTTPAIQAAPATDGSQISVAAAGSSPVAQTPPAVEAGKAKRSEIPEQYRWDLESIYPNEEQWEADFQAVRARLEELAGYEGTLAQSPARLLEYFKLQDEVGKKLDTVYVYAAMRLDEDTSNSRYQGMSSRASSLAVAASRATAFSTPEILSMPEEQIRDFLAKEPGLEPYRHLLEGLVRQKAHVRSAEVEEVLAQVGEVARTAEEAFTALTNADMKFPTITDENGQSVQITNANYGRFITSPDRRVRKEAWDAMTSTYEQYRDTLASTLAGSVRADVFSAQTRKYGSSLEAALAPDNLPVDVYASLIKSVNDNLGLLHRYMALRKKIMGLDELHMYDRYVPLLPDVDFKVSYDEAVNMVLAALEPMGQEYVETARQGLASRWVDVYETEGKKSGAYSWGAYTTHPFILMNFQGTLDDVYTLAHELGHAMHFHYMWKSQPYVYSNPSVFTAETTSNVHETLLTEYLLRTSTDPRVRTYLVNKEIDSFQGTFFLQALYAEFELETHRRADAGEDLSPDVLSQIWTDLGAKYFGDQVVLDSGWSIAWARVPHFYRAFYVYQYSTGLAGASDLAQQIMSQGQPAAQRYIDFLKLGSSDYPLELLRRAGVDMSSPEPVNRALQRFASLLDRLEAELK